MAARRQRRNVALQRKRDAIDVLTANWRNIGAYQRNGGVASDA